MFSIGFPDPNHELAGFGPEIVPQPRSWYSALHSHWTSLAGAIFSIIVMFLIQWIYALITVVSAGLLYYYIGKQRILDTDSLSKTTNLSDATRLSGCSSVYARLASFRRALQSICNLFSFHEIKQKMEEYSFFIIILDVVCPC